MSNKRKSKPRKVLPKAEKPYEKRKKVDEKQKQTPMQTEETPPVKPVPILPTPAAPAQIEPTPVVQVPEQPTPEEFPSMASPKLADAARPSRGPQCFKCQRWGHKSYGCTHEQRCVKCSKSHRASECPKDAVSPCCCANCSGAHPASYRGCPAAPKTRRRRKPQSSRPLQVDGKLKKTLPKLIQVLCKLLVRKDFFSEAQLAVIADELNDKPATSDASCQTDPDDSLPTDQEMALPVACPKPAENSDGPQQLVNEKVLPAPCPKPSGVSDGPQQLPIATVLPDTDPKPSGTSESPQQLSGPSDPVIEFLTANYPEAGDTIAELIQMRSKMNSKELYKNSLEVTQHLFQTIAKKATAALEQ